VLPERNKRQGQFIVEEVRKKIEFAFSEEQDPKKRLTVSGGVSENPLDGVTAEELMEKAGKALTQAKSLGKNHISG
jgi:GGDEF domain-containing protein